MELSQPAAGQTWNALLLFVDKVKKVCHTVNDFKYGQRIPYDFLYIVRHADCINAQASAVVEIGLVSAIE